jgi:hypothetical protein
VVQVADGGDPDSRVSGGLGSAHADHVKVQRDVIRRLIEVRPRGLQTAPGSRNVQATAMAPPVPSEGAEAGTATRTDLASTSRAVVTNESK